MLTVRQLKQRKIFEISLSESRIYKKWQTLAIIWEISDSDHEETVQNLESPRLSGRVGSPVYEDHQLVYSILPLAFSLACQEELVGSCTHCSVGILKP